MKNKKLAFNYLFLICFISMPWSVLAESIEETTITEKNYVVNPDIKLEIFNKYGTIHINTWDSDSLTISATQKFRASDRRQLDRLKKSRDFSITKTQYIIMIKSEIDDPAKELFSLIPLELGGSSESTLDLEIWMPAYVNLTLEHKFGDVFLGSTTGDAYIDVAHGQFKAHNFYGRLKLSTSYCNSSINYINDGVLTARFGDLSVDSASKISLESRSADVVVGHSGYLSINGRNDDILVRSCDELRLEGYFTKAAFNMVYGDVYSKTNYGNIGITFPPGYDNSVHIFSNYTDIELYFAERSGHFPVEVLHQKSRIMYPASGTNLKEEKVSGKDVIYKTKGTLGSGKMLDGGLNVEMFSGELKLIVK